MITPRSFSSVTVVRMWYRIYSLISKVCDHWIHSLGQVSQLYDTLPTPGYTPANSLLDWVDFSSKSADVVNSKTKN